jgi:pimeloyl-ACP methyl ester carboxylesterase
MGCPADRQSHESDIRENFLSLEAARHRHIGSSPHPSDFDPDLWTDEFAFLSRPGQSDIQSDLFFDYRTNVESYPKWQQWLRQRRPPLAVIWGRYDPSFLIAETEAYRRDVPNAEIHVLDAGHFALDEKSDEIAAITRSFLGRAVTTGGSRKLAAAPRRTIAIQDAFQTISKMTPDRWRP